MCYKTKPLVYYLPTGYKLKDRMYRIATGKKFDYFIFGCIVVNSIILMLQWHDQSDYVQALLDWINYTLSVVFFVEFIIKVIAFQCDYFRSGWNIVDFVIIVTSCADFILTMTLG